MAFKQKNLTPISNNVKTGVAPALWMYWNEDGDTVTTAGFIGSHYGISAKDQIMVVDSDGGNNAFYNATIDSDGVITLVANS